MTETAPEQVLADGLRALADSDTSQADGAAWAARLDALGAPHGAPHLGTRLRRWLAEDPALARDVAAEADPLGPLYRFQAGLHLNDPFRAVFDRIRDQGAAERMAAREAEHVQRKGRGFSAITERLHRLLGGGR